MIDPKAIEAARRIMQNPDFHAPSTVTVARALLAGEGPVLPYEAFAKEMIRLAWDGAVDGGDVQEAAIKYGLIVPAKYDPDKHGENVEADVGDDIYEFASPPSPAVRDVTLREDALKDALAAIGHADSVGEAEHRIIDLIEKAALFHPPPPDGGKQ